MKVIETFRLMPAPLNGNATEKVRVMKSRTGKRSLFIAAFVVLANLAAPLTVSAQTQFSELTKVNLKGLGFAAGFGSTVGVDGNTMIVGAPGFSLTALPNSPPSSEGAAFIYVRNANGGWALQQELIPNIVVPRGEAGACVALSGDTAIVGVPNGTPSVQSVFVYVRNGTTWTQQQQLTGAGYGVGCAISGNTIITSSSRPGSFYAADIFVRSGGVWTVQATLNPIPGTTNPSFFGDVVTIEGDTAVVGVSADGNLRGSVQVFVRSGATWTAQQRILASDGISPDGFARSVAINGNTLIVGAPIASGGSFRTGAAYVFVRSGSVWTQQQKLFTAENRPQSSFGAGVAIENNTIIVSSPLNNIPTNGGAAFVFQRSGTVWTETQKISGADSKIGDAFGNSVDLSNSNAVIGSAGDAIGSLFAGSAYLFALNPTSCTFVLSPTRSSLLPASGGTGSFTVTTQAGCAWQATVQDNVAWVTTSNAGTGSGTVNFNVAANAGKSRRSEITINGRQIYMTSQAGGSSVQQGDLDPNFGNAGLTTSRGFLANKAEGVAVQSDGKTVVVGGAFIFVPRSTIPVAQVLRYSADGLLDTTFDSDGIVTTAVSGPTVGNSSVFFDVVIQADGKIVAAGKANVGVNSDFAVVRYNANGLLDTTFGTGGIVITDFGSSREGASALTVAPDGKIVVSGIVIVGGDGLLGIVRYNTNGALDTTFDGDGKLLISDAGGFSDVAIQADGKIVTVAANISNRAIVLRHNTNGTADNTFDGDGRAVLQSGFSRGGVAVSPDGKIFLGVNPVDSQGGSDFAVARLNANGSLDTTFDGDGVAQADFNFSRDSLTGIALQPNGKIIAVGQVEVDQSGRYIHTGIARFDQNGSLDTSFGINGKKTTVEDGFQLYDVLDRAKAVALAPDGKIVVAGDYESRVGQKDVMVLRVLGTPGANEVLFANGFEG